MKNNTMPQEKTMVFPDQLSIKIRTSVPGHQFTTYTPSMTIKDSDEKSVKFNPLVRLNQSIINKIPPEYRIKEFFNKGLFQSMLNYIGTTPSTNLMQSTKNGNVDNNIKVTLNTIFPVNSVITIGGNPYTIGDVQWITGDWKIDVKQKKMEIDPNKITDPTLYTQFVTAEIISAEEELNRLPKNITFGSNYVGPMKPELEPEPKPSIPSSNAPLQIENAPLKPRKLLQIEDIPSPPSNRMQLQIESIPSPPLIPKKPLQIDNNVEPLLPTNKKPQARIDNQSTNAVEEISIEEERLFDTFKNELHTNTRETSFIRGYFRQTKYFNLIRAIFDKFPQQLKNKIRQFYFVATNYQPKKEIKSLSPTSYNMLCDQESIIKAPGDGDCFFVSVANGINLYNYENVATKIIYANYGKTELFTPLILREIVVRYLNKQSKDTIKTMIEVSQAQLEMLNNQFETSAHGIEMSEEDYMGLVDNVYHGNSNFLVEKPTTVPIDVDKYLSPFQMVKEKDIAKYIKSKDYWANNIAIEAMCDILHICVIPIEKYIHQKIIKLKPKDIDRLKTILVDNDVTAQSCSKKIMFIYHTNGSHYELATFKYKTKESIRIIGEGLRKIKEYSDKTFTIFKDDLLLPPIHILMLIYGSIYSKMDNESKKKFSIYGQIMQQIDIAVKNIIAGAGDDKEGFVLDFDDIFPGSRSIAQNSSDQVGGFTKTADESSASKLSYEITIDMELYPGTSMTSSQLSQAKCNSKYNAIKKAFSEFTGKPYIITPIYTEKKTKSATIQGGNRTKKRR
jgi:hypothetical protein